MMTDGHDLATLPVSEVHYRHQYEYLLTGMLSGIILLQSYLPSAGLE